MAGFNIANFRANGLVEGGARPTLFTVTLTFPTLTLTAGAAESVQFLCKAASLPPSNIESINVPYFGRTIKIAGDRGPFPDWNVTILNDENFLIRNALEEWHNSINTLISNRLDERVREIVPSVANSYKTIALVTQFAKTGPGDIDSDGAVKTYRFDGIFPTAIDPIRVAYEATNTIEEFDVTFTYDWWEPLTTAGSDPIFQTELNPS